MLKKNWIKKRLNNIEKNNLELLKFKFLKETISINSVYFDSPLHFLKPENYSDYRGFLEICVSLFYKITILD
ncbi:hypothetical protein SHM_11110 [Spiroplasma ixodetis]|uniref:Uncharacterized protein n=1 Tax=Spiroplasma ixodetis TaxID=2141 RepID=A0ABM8BUW6_9MOLU|nr:hypothetical protein SHM_11110 [Spiroplasma ixodetis]